MTVTSQSAVDTSGFGELEELFEHLIHKSPMGIFLYALDEKDDLIFRASNQTACDLLKRNCRDLVGKTIEEAFPSLVETDIPGVYKKIAAEGGSWDWECIQYKDEFVEAAYSVHAFQTSPGKMASISLDITERIKSERSREHIQQQMQQTQKLESLGILAGGIAHDFNNLLCVMLGGADLALSELPPGHAAREGVEMVHETAQQATELCRQMLAYSGKGKFHVEPLNLSDLIHGMEHLLKVSISKKASLHLNPSEKLPTVEADAAQMRQIILNLVVNASEALENENGVVSVRTGTMDCDREYLRNTYFDDKLSAGSYGYVEVSDTGRGMDETTKTRLFDPFFTTKQTGRGLGLAAVLGIVRGHSGSIKVYSEPGKGTTFKVLIPVSDKKTPEVHTPKQADEWKGEGTVLLVEDELAVRRVGKLMLERLGFTVLTAMDGMDGLNIYTENKDDIKFVVLDMSMPRMDGQETFRELRRLNPQIKVILTSGYNAQDATSHFVGKGLAGFIQKPFQLRHMRECIATVLA